MTKHEKKGQKGGTRQRILDVARGIFARRGFEGASVDAIVKVSGLSKGYFTGTFRARTSFTGKLWENRQSPFGIISVFPKK